MLASKIQKAIEGRKDALDILNYVARAPTSSRNDNKNYGRANSARQMTSNNKQQDDLMVSEDCTILDIRAGGDQSGNDLDVSKNRLSKSSKVEYHSESGDKQSGINYF